MPILDAYLSFDGNCAEAMRFYQQTLGGEIEMMMTFGESPMAAQTPPEAAGRIMHASLLLEGRRLMGSDGMLGQPFEPMQGFSLSLNYKTAQEAQAVFDLLADGGRVTMPLQKTFWSDAFGTVVDRFGTPWMFNTDPEPEPA